MRIARAACTALLAVLALAAWAPPAVADFSESEDRPVKDPDDSQDNALGGAAPVPWNLAPFASAFPSGAKLVRGTLDAGDVDAFAFSLAPGQLLLAALFEDARGERHDTSLGLFAAGAGPALASDDDGGSGFLSRLALPIASAGTYRVAVTGFGDAAFTGAHLEATGGLVPYQLVVAATSNPPAQMEAEGNDDLVSANLLPEAGGVVGATLGADDVDYFALALEEGDRLAVSVFDLASGGFTSPRGERNDASVGLFTPAGALASGGGDDDGGPGFMSNLLFTVPAGQGGTWSIAVSGFGDAAFDGAHAEAPFDYLLVVARERACPSVTPLIENLVASTPQPYALANLRSGDHYYTDRTVAGRHVLVDVAAPYECAQWIKTANDDKNVGTANHLSFTLAAPASLYIGYDTRATAEPAWLASGYTPIGTILDVADPDPIQEFDLLRRDFPAGPVVLGGNLAAGAGSNYVVFALPLDTTDPGHAFVVPEDAGTVSLTISGVTIDVVRASGQSTADFAAAIAAAVNANPTLAAARIFGLASGNAFVTTGALESVTTGPIPPIPVFPLAGHGAREEVVLLHGLLRSPRSLRPLAEDLEHAGYRTHLVGYPSTELGPEALIDHVAREIERCCADATRLHFVTHSLGGLLVRGYLARQRPASLGRVVMLAPPNHGSEWVDRYGDTLLFRWLLGPTAVQLGTGRNAFARRLPPVDYEVGVIAGTANRRPGASRVLLGASDGTVSVASTRLAAMTDFVALPESHTFILRSDAVAAQVRAFLESGRFAPTSAGSSAGTPRKE